MDRIQDLAVPSATACQPWLAGQGEANLVSVIVPTFNRAAMTVELLDAIAAQSWPLVETIVVDDGSTDGTSEAIANWQAGNVERKVTLVRQRNAGPGSARNRGLAEALGEFVYFIDSDDLIYPYALERMVEAVRSSGRAYSLATILIAGADGIAVRQDFESRPCQLPGNILACRWMTHGALYRRSAIARAGPFRTDLQVGEDSEFQWRIAATSGLGQEVHGAIGVRREHGDGHLSVGRDEAAISRTNVEIFGHYLGWANARGGLDPTSASRLAQYCLVAGLTLAFHGDWRATEAATAVAGAAHKHGVWWAKYAVLICRPRNRLYFAPFRFALWLVKLTRNAMRRVRTALRPVQHRSSTCSFASPGTAPQTR